MDFCLLLYFFFQTKPAICNSLANNSIAFRVVSRLLNGRVFPPGEENVVTVYNRANIARSLICLPTRATRGSLKKKIITVVYVFFSTSITSTSGYVTRDSRNENCEMILSERRRMGIWPIVVAGRQISVFFYYAFTCLSRSVGVFFIFFCFWCVFPHESSRNITPEIRD